MFFGLLHGCSTRILNFMTFFRMLLLIVAAAVLIAARCASEVNAVAAPEYTFKVVHVFPHDPNAYTQGLVYHNGFLYEGTGLNGRSSLRKVKLETGEVLQKIDVPAQFFGEGIAIFKNQILQLTWTAHTGFIYDLTDFHKLGQFTYPTEGWGLTSYGTELFMSDGTSVIHVIDANTFREKRQFTVLDGGKPVTKLNELEFVGDQIFANVWQSDRIARISPKTGTVVGWIDLSGLLSPVYRREQDSVLNGIAYDADGKRLFVTGKLWPSVFEIQIVPKNAKAVKN